MLYMSIYIHSKHLHTVTDGINVKLVNSPPPVGLNEYSLSIYSSSLRSSDYSREHAQTSHPTINSDKIQSEWNKYHFSNHWVFPVHFTTCEVQIHAQMWFIQRHVAGWTAECPCQTSDEVSAQQMIDRRCMHCTDCHRLRLKRPPLAICSK